MPLIESYELAGKPDLSEQRAMTPVDSLWSLAELCFCKEGPDTKSIVLLDDEYFVGPEAYASQVENIDRSLFRGSRTEQVRGNHHIFLERNQGGGFTFGVYARGVLVDIREPSWNDGVVLSEIEQLTQFSEERRRKGQVTVQETNFLTDAITKETVDTSDTFQVGAQEIEFIEGIGDALLNQATVVLRDLPQEQVLTRQYRQARYAMAQWKKAVSVS